MDSKEAEQVKEKLLKNIDSASLPPERAAVLKRQILSMDDEQLKQFMNKSSSECIFCSILNGKIKSYVIGESEDAKAVLEINPISKGHVLIIPKEHILVKDFSENILNFAKNIAKEIKEKLMPKDVELASVDIQDHGLINLIPIYNNEGIESERYKASTNELEGVSYILTKKEKMKVKKPRERVSKKNKKLWLPKRIP